MARLEGFDDWAAQVGAIAPPLGSYPWRLGVVLAVDPDGAAIGLADGLRGWIPFDEMAWARPALENQAVGPEPRQAGDVLTLGDVVLVDSLGPMPRPAEPETEATETVEQVRPLERFALHQVPAIQGALVVIDPHTGRVLALSGGYSFEMSEFNRATQAARQPGSAFKPFVYLAALEAGYTPSTVVLDSPLSIPIDNGRQVWTPSNYAGDFLGPTPLRVGLERSRNIMTVRLLLSIGLERVREIANEFGIYDDMPLHYSMALGAGEVTPLNLTAAYAMLANGGRRIVPTLIDRIQDRNGTTVYRHDYRQCDGCTTVRWIGGAVPEIPDNRPQIADPIAVHQVVSMMEGVIQRGTGARLRSLGFTLAGKTGTTNESRDAWFIGFTPDLVAGVFVGFDQPESLGRETGSSAAAPIFGAFMEQAMRGHEVPPFRIPPDTRLVRINPTTGALASGGETAIWESFRPGTEPGRVTIIDETSPYLFGDIPFTEIPFGDLDLSDEEGGATINIGIGGLY